MTGEPITPPADTKDWTFAISDGCPECGFAPPSPQETGARLRATIPTWQRALTSAMATQRPDPTTWSPTEYACHVRDVNELFRQRLALMLTQQNPTFANWDQDQTAIDSDYFHQQPEEVLAELIAQTTATADAFDAVADDQWQRPGVRSNGSEFTVATFALYLLHDVEHHVWDVSHSDA